MAETVLEIHNRMLKNTGDSFDKSNGSFIYDVTKAAGLEFEKTQNEIAAVEEKLDVENLKDDELARFVYQRTGVKRKLATKAVTTVVISGSEGSTVSQGDLVSTELLNFVVLENATIPQSGQITVFVACELYGAIGNVPANTITRFPVTINGLINVYNPEPITNGYEAESDADLRKRYYNKLQRPGKAGNKYHYEEWANEVVGVGGVRVIPKFNGPLTMKVVIIDSNKQPASAELIESVEGHIRNEMPFGVEELLVVSASPVVINQSVKLIKSGTSTNEIVESNIKRSITDYLKSIAFESDYVSYAKIGGLIIESDGVIDYSDLTVNGGTSNIPIGIDEVTVLGMITCTY
ncbi:baseplate J/gp47 family protein [Solibacillus silvestris]